MAVFQNPDLAFSAIIGGLLIGYWEFVRPGSFVPGAVGATLVMLGIASIAAAPPRPIGLALCGFALLLIGAGAWFQMGGVLAVIGGVVLAFGAHELTPIPVRWWAALSLSLPFAWLTN